MRKHTRLTFLMLWHIFAFLLSCQDFLLSVAAPYIPLYTSLILPAGIKYFFYQNKQSQLQNLK